MAITESQSPEYQTDARLKRRYRAERRFRYACMSALGLAAVFLVVFFADIISTGVSAFSQTQIRVDVTYTDETVEIPPLAVDETVRPFVSRGFLRQIPKEVAADPGLMGTTQTRWVLAKADVDQYRKGDENALSEAAAADLQPLEAQGDLRFAFNRWLFVNGDSKIPELAGMKAGIIGSLYVLTITMAFAFPIGVMSAIYLEEFAPDNWLTRAIEININNLAAVPSILFGLLGLAIFINFFGIPRSSALAGGLTIGLMTLPIVIISTRAALRAVPHAIREGALAMGATRWQMVRDHVLPESLPGILTGTIIGLAQAMGETAPLLLVGMIAFIPDAPGSFTEAATVMPAQIYTWAGMPETAYVERTAAAILILLTVLIVLNATAVYLRRRFERRW
jgi:phosphate transport system permease protein